MEVATSEGCFTSLAVASYTRRVMIWTHLFCLPDGSVVSA